MPASDTDLPWPVRAGKVMLWCVDFADGLKDSRQMIVARYSDERGGRIMSLDGQTAANRCVVRAYRELDPWPAEAAILSEPATA